jgi:hypothetical protein
MKRKVFDKRKEPRSQANAAEVVRHGSRARASAGSSATMPSTAGDMTDVFREDMKGEAK